MPASTLIDFVVMGEHEPLEVRVGELERLLGLMVKGQGTVQTVQNGALLRANARLTALTSLVRELCLHSGVSDEDFAAHLKERTGFYHDRLLQTIRQKDPNLAGRVDNRDPEEVSTDKHYPPLFPYDSEPLE